MSNVHFSSLSQHGNVFLLTEISFSISSKHNQAVRSHCSETNTLNIAARSVLLRFNLWLLPLLQTVPINQQRETNRADETDSMKEINGHSPITRSLSAPTTTSCSSAENRSFPEVDLTSNILPRALNPLDPEAKTDKKRIFFAESSFKMVEDIRVVPWDLLT